MIKVFFAITLIVLAQSIINGRLPDAIRCGADNSCCDGAIYVIHSYQVGNPKRMYYCQILNSEHRCVIFNVDGSYRQGYGHQDSRRGCQHKSISTLDKQGRTIYYALDPFMHKNQTRSGEEIAMKNKIEKLEEREIIKDKIITKMDEEVAAIKIKMAKMEQQTVIKDTKIEKLQNKISELKKKLLSFSANFWDYEQIKQKWVKEFKRELLNEIKEKGLQIGSRWKVQQEGAAFVVRDIQGSKVKDSRIAFAQDTFSNPK